MQELDETEFKIFLDDIQRKFLCCYPLHCISWRNFPKNLEWRQQEALMDYTFNFPLNVQFPIKMSYQLNFLKKLLPILEKNCLEVHDVVYGTYCRLQQSVTNDLTNKYAFKHYILKPGIHLTLRESKSFVAEGTTGLCSWQASIALADFFMNNRSILIGKTVLELGAGAGLCGLVILKLCQPRHLLLSDGSSTCVELIRENMRRNFLQALEENHRFKMNTQIVECVEVPWSCIQEKVEINDLKPDIIIAADVVYDDTCFKELTSAISYVFKLNKNKVEMYLAATIRNEYTFKGFLNIIESLCFQITECDVIPMERSYLHWDRSTTVKIFKLTK